MVIETVKAKTSTGFKSGNFKFPETVQECVELLGESGTVRRVRAKLTLEYQAKLRVNGRPRARLSRSEVIERLTASGISRQQAEAIIDGGADV